MHQEAADTYTHEIALSEAWTEADSMGDGAIWLHNFSKSYHAKMAASERHAIEAAAREAALREAAELARSMSCKSASRAILALIEKEPTNAG